MLLLDATATRARLPLGPLVAALRSLFISGCEVPPRHVHTVAGVEANGPPAGTVLLMPAWRPGLRLGIKTVNVFPGNAALGLPGLHAVYSLFDARTGVPLAQLDGSELTTRRTVAASALAASFLAREDAHTLLIVGAGRLAADIAEAMRCVRPSLQRVCVWARKPEAAQRLALSLQQRGWEAQAVPELRAAAGRADIISCATMATMADGALLQGAWLAAGTHVDLMGGFTPTMREADGACLRRARVYIDTEEAMAKAGDLLQAVAEGHFTPGALQGTLAQLCRGQRPGRQSAAEITLFKSVGTALEDLAAAELACGFFPSSEDHSP